MLIAATRRRRTTTTTTNATTTSISAWDVVSELLGWSYFFVWSISLYPQIYLNWKRKSVKGLSIDYLFYHWLGFLCYSVYNLAFFSNGQIRDEYRQRYPNSESNLVRLNDVVFSIHGLALSTLLLLQTCIYKKQSNQKISSFAASFVWLTMIGSVLVVAIIHYGGFIWLDFMYYLSSVDMVLTFIKYLPQAWLNYKRKSTSGWSIQYILWDLTGGLLSILQLLLDASIDGDFWSGIAGDNVKLGLGLLAVLYDGFFLLQHYVLYPRHSHHHPLSSHTDEERRGLLGEGHVCIEDDEYEEEEGGAYFTTDDDLSTDDDEASSLYNRGSRKQKRNTCRHDDRRIHYGTTS
ncbi:PQ loop repeat-domain-containing protein [Mycotypha africana]|uniref:PQ loop repeat-domain-containing protein n=1 Tax=Mycotypha africana TaxID=64632 RepID=UPI002301F5C2|nr:PQ loop repeat-domain-containing protein [Mycotypha africana]KAI8967075.1 PQ loop repeat-domain-containing protein [Mycotypha africana]